MKLIAVKLRNVASVCVMRVVFLTYQNLGVIPLYGYFFLNIYMVYSYNLLSKYHYQNSKIILFTQYQMIYNE